MIILRKGSTLKNLKLFLGLCKRKKATLAVITSLSFLGMILGFVEPQMTSRVLVALQSILTNNVQSAITALLFILALLAVDLSQTAEKFFEVKLYSNISLELSYNLKMNVASKTASSSISSISKHSIEDLSFSILESCEEFVGSALLIYSNIWNILIGVCVLIYTAFISLNIFVLFVCTLVIILIIQKNNFPKMKDAIGKSREKENYSKQVTKSILKGFQDMKQLVLGSGLKSIYKDALKEDHIEKSKASMVRNKNERISQLVQYVFVFIFLIISTYQLYTGKINIENVIVLFLYKNYIYTLVGSFCEIGNQYADFTEAGDRISSILQFKSGFERENFGHNNADSAKNSEIQIQNISYKNILKNISLTISPNSFVSIVGRSGCGKSTLLNVLSHSINPTEGIISIGDTDTNDFDGLALRRLIALVQQTPQLFSFLTIRDNLKLAKSDVSDEELHKVLSLADADDFVSERGLDVTLEELNLSGGQKQRLCIARALLKDPKIILFDESTSALDNISQGKVVSSFKKLCSEHTIVMVAHRLSIAKSADKVVFMKDGEISDVGTFEEIYNRNADFRELAKEEATITSYSC